MNFNQWYIFHFVQRPSAIFLVISWFHAHRISGLYRQKTEPSAISQLHHHWKFYHLRSSAKIEINNNLMVQGQDYMVDVTSLPKQALIIFVTITIDQFWPFFFDRCVQFVQLTTVEIQINRLVPWKQLKKYHTFPIPPDSIICFHEIQLSMFFVVVHYAWTKMWISIICIIGQMRILDGWKLYHFNICVP